MLYDLRKAVRRLWLLLERYGVSVAGADAATQADLQWAALQT